MVLEGLKKAESLIKHLHLAGYQREDERAMSLASNGMTNPSSSSSYAFSMNPAKISKPIKPENFDQEFSSKAYSNCLQKLLCRLQDRILNEEEVSRVEYLAELGLLDGLVDDNNFECPDNETHGNESKELRRVEDLNQIYEAIIGRMEIELQLLQSTTNNHLNEEQSSMTLSIEEQSTINFINDEPTDIGGLSNLLNEFERASEELRDSILVIANDIFTPPTANAPDRYRTISNKEAIKRPWNPNDLQLYHEKIDSAIREFAKLGMSLEKEFLLKGENFITAKRCLFQISVLNSLLTIEKERQVINQLVMETLEKHLVHWNGPLTEIENLHVRIEEINKRLAIKVDSIELPIEFSKDESKEPVLDTLALHTRLVNDLQPRINQLTILADRLTTATGEIRIIPDPIINAESNLRGISQQMSSLLQDSAALCHQTLNQ